MLKRELVEQLQAIATMAGDKEGSGNDADTLAEIEAKTTNLIEEINDNGVLDVQCPDSIAEDLNLLRPA